MPTTTLGLAGAAPPVRDEAARPGPWGHDSGDPDGSARGGSDADASRPLDQGDEARVRSPGGGGGGGAEIIPGGPAKRLAGLGAHFMGDSWRCCPGPGGRGELLGCGATGARDNDTARDGEKGRGEPVAIGDVGAGGGRPLPAGICRRCRLAGEGA